MAFKRTASPIEKKMKKVSKPRSTSFTSGAVQGALASGVGSMRKTSTPIAKAKKTDGGSVTKLPYKGGAATMSKLPYRGEEKKIKKLNKKKY